MPNGNGDQEQQTVVSSRFEAYSSDILPHHSIIEGYEKAIDNGGKEVISIVKRQQLFTFITNLASILTTNLIPLILALPILFAISAGALIEVTIAASVPIGLFTAGSAIGRVVTSLRGGSVEQSVMLRQPSQQTEPRQLPPSSDEG